VVILDDPAGTGGQFSPAEVAALQTYADDGHDLIGTFLTFWWLNGGAEVDNSALAPLFGLKEDAGWTADEIAITPTYKLSRKRYARPLVRDLPKPYVSTGYNYSQRPGDLTWSKNELHGAKLVGRNADKSAAITVLRAAQYNAIYIANMPEYEGGTADKQFLYNAIIYPKKH
jgi:hypothetical protein